MSYIRVYRTLDAALNRAGEGLRVIEDYARFVLDDWQLTESAKSIRHELTVAAGELDISDRLAARDTLADVGAAISTPTEAVRHQPWDVCVASFKRVQQSLRTLEEFGKLLDDKLPSRFETLRYRVYTLEKVVGVAAMSGQRLAGTRLMVLVDGGHSSSQFEQLVADLVDAGVHAIQLRDKELADGELLARARLLRQLTRDTPTLCIVNDRADIAALADADAVHLGQEDLSVTEARVLVGPRMLVGVSTHNIEQARAAVFAGANYLGAGPTFPSQTKSFDRFAGLDFLRELAAEVRLPSFAIGGINADNLSEVLATGVSRVAVGAAITKSYDPGVAAGALMSMLKTSVAAVHTHDP
jgi:thiamine-phosphate pyrophosphorylase